MTDGNNGTRASEVIADAAQKINSAAGLDQTLQHVVETARDALPEIDHVGVTLIDRDDTWRTSAATDDLVLQFDDLQYDLRQGPCVDTLTQPQALMVKVQNAAHEARWNDYIPRALRLGLRSQVALKLALGDSTVGGLNLYSTSSNHVDEDTQELAALFATHATLAIGHARQVDNLYLALQSRTVIGQAVGITMQRYSIGPEAAFRYLVRESTHQERKLRLLAADIVAGASGTE